MPSKRMLFLILQQNKVVLYAEISSRLARKGFCGAEDNDKLIEKAAVKSVSSCTYRILLLDRYANV